MPKKLIKPGILLATVFVVISLLFVTAGATSYSLLDDKVTVADSANSSSVSNGTVTITAKGSLFSKKTNNITITNKSDSQAKLSFDYTVDKFNSFKIAGVDAAASGSYSAVLEAGGTLSITLVSNRGLSNTTATLKLSKFSLTAAAASSNVTINYDSTLGSVTAAGATVLSGGVVSDVTLANGVALVAAPSSGAKFLGWVDAADNSVISTAASYTLTPAVDMTVKAIFGSASKPCFGVGAEAQKSASSGLLGLSKIYYYQAGISYLFDDLNAAANFAASSSTNKAVVLMNDGTLSAGTYTIPAGVTLLIPFDAANSLYTTAALSTARSSGSRDDGTFKDLYVIPSAYRTLTLADGANLIINGAMSLSAKHTYAAGGQDAGSSPSGPVSFVQMQGNSNITVNNGGALYAYGFITGSGSVTVNSGATVYELFQIMDFRGGTQSTDMDNGVFPLSQYYVQNIEVPMTIHYGATEYAYTTIYMSSADFGSAVNFIASKDAMFKLTSGYVVKKYNGSTDRLEIEINGNIEISSVDIKVSTSSINSKDYELPINGNISVTVKSGASITIGQDLAFLPGTEMIVEAGANCTLSSNNNLYIYDSAQWGSFCGASNKVVIPVKYAPGRTATRSTELKNQKDAALWINGVADFSAGYVYTTAGGANIYSTGVGIVNLKPGTQTITHQLVQGKGYTNIPITPAKLKNGDGNYFEYAKGNTFVYKNNVWQCKDHLSVPTEGKAPTCTEAGLSEGSECSACTQILVAQTTVPATGHTEVTDAAVDPTCTETGLTEGCHCSRCNEVFTAQKEVPAKGHSWGTWSIDNATHTCTSACGNDSGHKISVLLEYRMNSYIWLNATVTSTAGKPGCSDASIAYEQYLIKKVLSNHITDSVKVSFTLNGTTPELEIGFLEYAKLLSADANTSDATVKLLASMLMYGEASEDYFGNGGDTTGNDNGTILTAYQTNLLNNTAIPERLKSALRACALSGHSADKDLLQPADTNANYGEKGLENGLTISTTGAAFYFDEALRLSVGYKFAKDATVNADGTITFGDTTYTVLQVGLLVQELEELDDKWTMCDVLYAENGVTAYIAYDNSAKIDPTGPENHPDVGPGGPDAFVNTLGASGEINFDLLVKEYNKGFALRTYAVLEANGTQYVIYGKQYGYGLEAYVKATYGDDAAFNPLLATAWGYAQAAVARYPEVK